MHTIHIPVMGTGFSIDTPIRVAPFGISSVMSIMDDMLVEKIRKHYCEKFNLALHPSPDGLKMLVQNELLLISTQFRKLSRLNLKKLKVCLSSNPMIKKNIL